MREHGPLVVGKVDFAAFCSSICQWVCDFFLNRRDVFIVRASFVAEGPVEYEALFDVPV
ncbi:MAG: hypothetical protein GY822_08220 [Deltaproteobacteria bacterium]|nr:hypothetical protein [Deltaproteobacteria bacterium]